MIKHAIPKMVEVTHSDGQLWGDIEWAIELLYNSVKTGSQLLWRQDAVKKASTQQREPWAPIQFWRPDQLETRCGRESLHPAEWAPGPRMSSWGSDKMEK